MKKLLLLGFISAGFALNPILSSAQIDSCLGLEPPKGFAITDNTAEYYRIDAIDSTTPEVTSCPIVVNGTPMVMNGEGSAYEPFLDRYYVFNNSALYYIDLSAPCDGSTNTYLINANTSVVGTSQGAELVYDSVAMQTYLWVLDDALPAGFLRKLDPTTGNEISNVVISGASKLDGIAVDPQTGLFYGQDDDVVEVYLIDTATGVATTCFTIPPMDGEALSFGSDGRIYTEMDRGDTARIIWAGYIPPTCDNSQIPITAVATFTNTTGDVENFGMNGAACFLEAPLYVNLLEFNGKAFSNYNELFWESSIELNNSHYVLEKSNGLNYSAIATIHSQGELTSNSNTFEYSYRDNNPQSINYYRLKSIDLEGNVKVHRTIVLNKKAPSTINIFPNPSNNVLNIDISQEDLGDVKITLSDLQGRELYTSGYLENTGSIVQNIDMSKFSAGYYIIQVTNDIGFDLIKPIIKK